MLAALDAELGGIGLVGGEEDDDSEPDEPDPAIHQAELEKKNALTKFPADDSPVEPILAAVKREIEDHYDNFCDSTRY